MYVDYGNGWEYISEYWSVCDDRTYTWYLTSKKSTDDIQKYYIEVTNSEGDLINTLTQDDFRIIEK